MTLSSRSRALAVLIALVVAITTLLARAPRADAWVFNQTQPVLFVHGINLTSSSTDCGGDFDAMIATMRSLGFSGPMVRVGFYSGDTHCDANLFAAGTYANGDSWRQIAKAFSWFVYNNYTRLGQAVSAVGYSMGGLIIRGAIHGAATSEAGFSPPINISQAATLGAPHAGSGYAYACIFPSQCASLRPSSPDIQWNLADCYPQGSAGTLWTVIGSNDDSVVSWQSAINLCTFVDRKTVFELVNHAENPNYMHQLGVQELTANAIGLPPNHFTSGLPGNKCIDVRGGSAVPGTPVQLYDCNGGYAQLWTHSFNGHWTNLQALGRCLERPATAPGQRVYIAACNGTEHQQWYAASDATFYAGTFNGSPLCLDVPGSDITNGNQLQVWYCNGLPSQRFYWT